MPALFSGEIGDLLLLAAPSAAGKSTFLHNPGRYLPHESLPAELRGLHELAGSHRPIMTLAESVESSFPRLCVHVDLSQPLRRLAPRPGSREELLDRITPELFSGWPELEACLRCARQIHVVTLFVRREEHLRRWLQRGGQISQQFSPQDLPASILCDATRQSELHRRYYHAWHDYARSLPARSYFILDAESDCYRWLPSSQFEAELRSGDGEHQPRVP